MNIKEIAEKAHNHAVKKGFYGNDSEWEISKKIEEESMELIEAIDKKRYADIQTFHEMFNGSSTTIPFLKVFNSDIKNSIGDEMADNIILMLSSAMELGINIEKHITYKQKYNALREDHR